jgi:type VI secretion system protein VasD
MSLHHMLQRLSASPSLPLTFIAVWVLGTLSGCGSAGALGRDTSEVSFVPDAVFEITAESGLNPDSKGVPKPVQVRIYQLRSKSSFERMGFLDLQDKDEAALGSDFVRRDELLVFPGERRSLTIKGNPEVKLFGALVAYRDLDKGTWRAMASSPNSLELRKTWWGFGRIEKPGPIGYFLKLAPSKVQLDIKLQDR